MQRSPRPQYSRYFNPYDRRFKAVFDAIRELMAPPPPAPDRRIGSVQGR
jgi:hypothetical protein